MESIGNIAESILGQEVKAIQEGKKARPSVDLPTPAEPEGPDYSNVQVSQNDVSRLLGESNTPKPEPQTKTAPSREMLVERASQVISDLHSKLNEAREVIKEMTTYRS